MTDADYSADEPSPLRGEGEYPDGSASGAPGVTVSEADLGLAALARFGEPARVGRLALNQGHRCAGCGQPLELGSVVLTLIAFPAGDVPAAVHAECRDGLAMVRTWAGLKAWLRVQMGPDMAEDASRWAARAMAAAYRARHGDAVPAPWLDDGGE